MHLRAYQSAAAPPDERRVEGMTRHEACLTFSRKILHLARRMAEQAGDASQLTPEDLVSYGVVGLLEAYDRFDANRGVDFTSYASTRIAGSMFDAIRTVTATTRRDRKAARTVTAATARIRAELGREPRHAEIAEALGVDLEGYWRLRGFTTPHAFVSLPLVEEESEDADDYAQAPDAPARLDAQDAREQLRVAIGRLSERERNVILLYYSRDCSLAEIAEIFEVTPSRISQILTAARERLKKALGSDFHRHEASLGFDQLQEGAA